MCLFLLPVWLWNASSITELKLLSCPRVLIYPPARVSTPKLQVISGQIVTEEIHYTEGSETKTVSLLPSLSITREIHYNTSRAKVKMALIVAMRFWRLHREMDVFNLKHFPTDVRENATLAIGFGYGLVPQFKWGVNKGRDMRWSDTARLSGHWHMLHMSAGLGQISFFSLSLQQLRWT